MQNSLYAKIVPDIIKSFLQATHIKPNYKQQSTRMDKKNELDQVSMCFAFKSLAHKTQHDLFTLVFTTVVGNSSKTSFDFK